MWNHISLSAADLISVRYSIQNCIPTLFMLYLKQGEYCVVMRHSEVDTIEISFRCQITAREVNIAGVLRYK